MAWNDLSISQKSQLMNIFRRNGVTSLIEMKRMYDNQYPASASGENTGMQSLPTISPLRGGNQFYDGGYNTKQENNADFVGPRTPWTLISAGDITMPEYNIFDDEASYSRRDAHLKSLDAFIKANPTIDGLDTATFRDLLSAFAGLESGYRSDASNSSGYSGYYGLKGGINLSENDQHKAAYKYLAKLFKHSITRDDVQKGIDMGYTPAQILYKYWNQGNNATEFFQNGSAATIGNNPELELMGNNINVPVDYYDYIPDAVTDDYHIVKKGDTFSAIQEKVRKPGRHYNRAGKDLEPYNKEGVIDGKLHIGDTVFFVPRVQDKPVEGNIFWPGGPLGGEESENQEKSYSELLQDYEQTVNERKKAWDDYDEIERKIRERVDSESERIGLARYDYRKDPVAYELSLERDRYSDNRFKADEKLRNAEIALGKATIERSIGTSHDLLKYPRWSSTEERAKKYLAESGIRESEGAKSVADFFNSYADSEGFQRIIDNQAEWGKNRYPYKRLYNPIEYGKTGYTSSANQLRKKLLEKPMGTEGVYDMNASGGLGFNTTGPGFHFIINAAGNPFVDPHKEEFPYWFELTHEMLHDYNFVGLGQGDALNQNTGAKNDGHDNLKQEKHSDLEALRFMLFNEGIYDSRGNVDATSEDIKKLRELYPNLRPLEQMSDEQAAWMINHVADTNNGVDLSNIAANGGNIKKVSRVKKYGGIKF